MHRIDTSGHASGLFKESPGPATKVGATWLNDIQENLMGVLELFVVTPVKSAYDQLAGIFESFGVPGRKAITDLDALTRSGFYASSPTATGRPAGIDGGNVFSNFDFADEADGVQLFFEQAGPRVWTRHFDGADWSDWVEVLTSASGAGVLAKGVAQGQGFNGACTVTAAMNATVSRTGSGAYYVNFDVDMPDGNYVPLITVSQANTSWRWLSKTQAGFAVTFQQANANVGDSPTDPSFFSFAVF